MESGDNRRHYHSRYSAEISRLLTNASTLPGIHLPIILPNSIPTLPSSSSGSTNQNSLSPMQTMASSETGSTGAGLPSSMRILTRKGGGPAFVGQVFSMCDLSGTGLMAVSTHFDIPFLSKRTPEWLKKMFAAITKRERNGPVFRFFMDLGDAVSYVKQLNIPSGVVGSCRLDIAYEHFKEKPDMFQFVPNEKQVKEANKLLKALPYYDGNRKVEGVPVFSARNLDIAIATNDGIKWYTPYFFDKKVVDSILDESVDQHFHTLIERRHMQRRKDVFDDNLSAEVVEEMGESSWDPPEEVLDEIGHPGIPLSVISKAVEIQLLYAVDRVIIGNKWLRKAFGIQPKFPYIVDSFERRTAASLHRVKTPNRLISDSEFEEDAQMQKLGTSDVIKNENTLQKQSHPPIFRFPLADWLRLPWSKHRENQSLADTRGEQFMSSPFLPNVTMVGMATTEPGKMSKSSMRKTMDELTKELEKAEQVNRSEFTVDERDPLFVANLGDYHSGFSKAGPARWVQPVSSKP